MSKISEEISEEKDKNAGETKLFFEVCCENAASEQRTRGWFARFRSEHFDVTQSLMTFCKT